MLRVAVFLLAHRNSPGEFRMDKFAVGTFARVGNLLESGAAQVIDQIPDFPRHDFG